ncbi:MAG: hypothetical protein JJU20_09020 [Opitutales bacterium]|nr:hypothetical protein [Opitutales bacterium]
MKIFFPVSIFLLLAGGITGFYLGQRSIEESFSSPAGGRDSAVQSRELERLRQQLRDSDRSLAAAQVELSRLRNENRLLLQRRDYTSVDLEDEASTQDVEGDDRMERRERWEAVRAERQTAFARRQARTLANRLGLSEEQEAVLAETMAEQQLFGRRGGMGADASSELNELMADILDDEQYGRWQDYRNEEVRVRAETYANVELGRMSLMLGLEEYQKDAVFGILYEQAVDLSEGSMEGLRLSREQPVDLLRGILSPTQLEAYEESLEGGWTR